MDEARFSDSGVADDPDDLSAVLFCPDLVTFGMLAGVAVERMRFDHKRADILARYDKALSEWHAFRMELERTVNRNPHH